VCADADLANLPAAEKVVYTATREPIAVEHKAGQRGEEETQRPSDEHGRETDVADGERLRFNFCTCVRSCIFRINSCASIRDPTSSLAVEQFAGCGL